MVTGADLIFHYNRFYDAAMQMKENFSYIISLYGYQQSGRIVNALWVILPIYKALVLLSGTWFRYQILSNLLLGTLSATSLYLLMREVKVKYAHPSSCPLLCNDLLDSVLVGNSDLPAGVWPSFRFV